MKMKLLIAALSLCLLLGGCDQTRRTPPPGQPEASQPAGTEEGQGEPKAQPSSKREPQETDPSYYQEQYGTFLEHFFLFFPEEFSSVSELNPETVLFFSLIETVGEYPRPEIPFDYDESLDAYYVPRPLLNQKTEQYFGIPGFDFMDTPRYVSKNDSYAYTLAHGFPILYPQIISTNIQGETVTFEVAYTNPEAEGKPTTQKILFSFKESEADGKTYLQAISAKAVE